MWWFCLIVKILLSAVIIGSTFTGTDWYFNLTSQKKDFIVLLVSAYAISKLESSMFHRDDLIVCSSPKIYFAALQSGSFMEVVKEVAKRGSEARDSVAIRADEKSYSYVQLISSAWRISRLLCGAELDVVSVDLLFPPVTNLGGKWFFFLLAFLLNFLQWKKCTSAMLICSS